MTLQNQVSRLSKPQLVRMITAIYGIEAHIDDIIDRHLAANGNGETRVQSVVQVLVAQIEALRNQDDFIHYDAGMDFAACLERMLSDIDEILGDDAPAEALQLMEQFLTLPESLYERVDDSAGCLGDVFHDAVELWLAYAESVREENPDAEDWVGRVLKFFDNDDYGVFYDIIAESPNLLTDQELRQLARRFETEAQQAQDGGDDPLPGYSAGKALHGLKSVAIALADMHLYERSILLSGPEPNTLQLASLVEFALSAGTVDRAAFWLEQPEWQRDPHRHRSLRNAWLQKQGRTEQLKQELLDEFRQRPTHCSLDACWAMADGEEREDLRRHVEALAESPENLTDQVQMLIAVNSLEVAERLLVGRFHELNIYHYTTLKSWAYAFEADNRVLALVVCYRALLDDILERGFSRAYHHAADYFHRLLAIDEQIGDYQGLTDSQSYIRKLQSKHGRKWLFWKAADYPAKPVISRPGDTGTPKLI